MNQYLFVYGTLMEDHENEYAQLLQKNSELIDKGFIYARKYDLGSYPGIKIDISKTHKTKGELFLIKTNPNLVIKALDYYEGYDLKNPKESLFIRKEVNVFTKENKKTKAWVYEYTQIV